MQIDTVGRARCVRGLQSKQQLSLSPSLSNKRGSKTTREGERALKGRMRSERTLRETKGASAPTRDVPRFERGHCAQEVRI